MRRRGHYRPSLCSVLHPVATLACSLVENIVPLVLRVGDVMKDMQAHLEHLRVQIVECEMIRDLATDMKKRELFDRLAQHYKVLASEVERAIKQAE
jgi:hypothetical protein